MPRKPKRPGRKGRGHTSAPAQPPAHPEKCPAALSPSGTAGLQGPFFSPQTGQTEHGRPQKLAASPPRGGNISTPPDHVDMLLDDEPDPDEQLEPNYDIGPDDGPELEPEPDDRRYTYKWPGEKEVARVLRRLRGNMYLSAQVLGVSRTTLYEWVKQNPRLEKVRAEGLEIRLDIAEAKNDELIMGVTVQRQTKKGPVIYKRAPNLGAIQLLTQGPGKQRGYGSKAAPSAARGGSTPWAQVRDLIKLAQEEFTDDPQRATPAEPPAVGVPEGLERPPELGSRPG